MSFTVLIAGGGPAGLEAALALHRLAGDRVATTVLAPEAEFVTAQGVVITTSDDRSVDPVVLADALAGLDGEAHVFQRDNAAASGGVHAGEATDLEEGGHQGTRTWSATVGRRVPGSSRSRRAVATKPAA